MTATERGRIRTTDDAHVRLTPVPRPRTARVRATGLILAGALVSGCVIEVERDRETEDCIEELRDEGVETTEAQQECMGID